MTSIIKRTNARVPGATLVFDNPDLADMIFKPVRAHWKKTKRNYYARRRQHDLMKQELQLIFYTANLEVTYLSYDELMPLRVPLTVVVAVRNEYYTIRHKLLDYGNDKTATMTIYNDPAQRWHDECEVLFEHEEQMPMLRSLRNRFFKYNFARMEGHPLHTTPASQTIIQDFLNIPYYYHLVMMHHLPHDPDDDIWETERLADFNQESSGYEGPMLQWGPVITALFRYLLGIV